MGHNKCAAALLIMLLTFFQRALVTGALCQDELEMHNLPNGNGAQIGIAVCAMCSSSQAGFQWVIDRPSGNVDYFSANYSCVDRQQNVSYISEDSTDYCFQSDEGVFDDRRLRIQTGFLTTHNASGWNMVGIELNPRTECTFDIKFYDLTESLIVRYQRTCVLKDVESCNQDPISCRLPANCASQLQAGNRCLCTCNPGYEEVELRLGGISQNLPTCINIDECSSGDYHCDDNSTVCVDTTGSYECKCRPGQSCEYEGTPTTSTVINDIVVTSLHNKTRMKIITISTTLLSLLMIFIVICVIIIGVLCYIKRRRSVGPLVRHDPKDVFDFADPKGSIILLYHSDDETRLVQAIELEPSDDSYRTVSSILSLRRDSNPVANLSEVISSTKFNVVADQSEDKDEEPAFNSDHEGSTGYIPNRVDSPGYRGGFQITAV